jgi:hypothetical protein
MTAMIQGPFEVCVCRAGILPANSVTTAAKMAALQNDAVASGPLALQFHHVKVMIR